jgi:iron complex outermembrane receptor protein
MKRICSLVLILLCIQLVHAQRVPDLQLKVISRDGILLDGASARLSKDKTSLNSLSDGSGRVLFKNAKYPARVTVSYAGYETFDTTLLEWNDKLITVTLTPLRSALQPVEVKGIRAGKNAPFAKTDISQATIEKNNTGRDIPFLLNQTPNVVVNSDAGNGVGYTGIRIRGSDASRINMTINGIPYNDAESQGLFFVNLPDLLSSVSSIQVQRGVGTSSNGAGAFGATMNFSTHSYNPEAYGELNNTVGSFETFKHTLKAGTGLMGRHFTVDARLSNIRSEGFVDRAFSRLSSGQLTVGYWGEKTSVRLNTILGKEKTYQAWYGISEDDKANNRRVNYAGTERPDEPYDNETDNYWQNHYQLLLNHEFNNKWIFNTALFLTTGRGYFEQYKADETLADYGIPPINTGGGAVTESDLVRQLWLKNQFFGQVFSLQKSKGSNEWTMGGGWSRYLGGHFGEVIWTEADPKIKRRWYDYDADKTDANVYAKWMRNLSNSWRLFADLQYRYVQYNIEGFRNNPGVTVNQDWHFVNPKAGISYSKGNWSGFFSYAMGNKEPNRDDFEAGINQQPLREQLHDFEFNITRKSLARNFQMGVTLYYMNYKDQLVLTGQVNDVGAYTRVNLPNSFRAGAEFEMAYRWKKLTFKYNGGFSQNKIRDFKEYVDDYDNGGQKVINHGATDIAFSPVAVQFLSISYLPVRQLELEWMTKHVSRQFLDNTSNTARSLDGFLATDIRATYAISPKKWIKEIKLVGEVYNLFNALYEPNGYTFSYISGGKSNTENFYFPMANRNFMLALNIRL